MKPIFRSSLFDSFPHIISGFAGRGITKDDLTRDHDLSDLLILHQVHGTEIHAVTQTPPETQEGDGWITNTPRLGLGIKTADCGCILLYAHDTRRIAAVHAGWRSTFEGIIEACLKKLTNDTKSVYAVLGPCIRQESYQVDEAFYQNFLNRYPKAKTFFAPDAKHHYHFDLPAMLQWQLQQAGVSHIDDIGINTYNHPDFYSHRRATHAGTEKTEGRQLSFIGLTS